MTAILKKPIDQITGEDIEELIASQVLEGERIEFKERLPVSKQGKDQWGKGGDISDRARNTILEEVVAFANAYGGTLILGVAESKTKPSAAQKIVPIERCAELADRLALVFRNCVEPQLPSIEIASVLTNGDAGVVVLRTPNSRMAPHRVAPTRKCTVRRGDRCEELTMREIQDMTINVARGLQGLHERLSTRQDAFADLFEELVDPSNAFGLRITAAPVGTDLRIDHVVLQGSIDGRFAPPTISVFRTREDRDDGEIRLFGLEHHYSMAPHDWKPQLRAVRAEVANYALRNTRVERKALLEVHCDGLVELAFVSQREFPDMGERTAQMPIVDSLPLFEFARICMWADKVRDSAGAPGSEFAIQTEFVVRGGTVPIEESEGPLRGYRGVSARLVQPGIRFPLYSLGSASDIGTLCELFERDFWNAMGKDCAAQQGNIRISLRE